uniref:Aurora kinase n=1 Tax=Panagrellus redivivus TaxID=6233 RepID=A0A7E4UY07_PANRE
MFSCIYRRCNETFANVEELKNHCVENHRKAKLARYPCPVEQCGYKYKNRSGVYKHLRTNHADMEEVEGNASDGEIEEIEGHNFDHEEVERTHSRRDISRNDSAVEIEENETMNTARNATLNVSRRQKSVRTPVQEAPVTADGDNHQDSPPRVKRNLTLNDFDIGRPLGSGTFGKVYLAREKEHRIYVALKIFFKSKVRNGETENHIIREIDIQCHLRHPNILRMYNYFFDKKKIYLVLEFALYGELFKILVKRRRFDEKRTAWYIFQVADALNYCHSKNIIHRDIKPENILVSADGSLKLADFGASIHSVKERTSVAGTKQYVSPEMVRNIPHNYRVDNWAVGVLCYELLDGHPPFESGSNAETFALIKAVKFKYTNHFTAGSKDLISKLLVDDPEKRLSLDEVMDHYWIKEQLKLAKKKKFRVV